MPILSIIWLRSECMSFVTLTNKRRHNSHKRWPHANEISIPRPPIGRWRDTYQNKTQRNATCTRTCTAMAELFKPKKLIHTARSQPTNISAPRWKRRWEGDPLRALLMSLILALALPLFPPASTYQVSLAPIFLSVPFYPLTVTHVHRSTL